MLNKYNNKQEGRMKYTKSILALTVAFVLSGVANAQNYTIKIPVEVTFVTDKDSDNGNQNEGNQFNFARYNGAGTLSWGQAGGDFSSFDVNGYKEVLLRGYGYHTVIMFGHHEELIEKASNLNFEVNGYKVSCPIFTTALNYTDYGDGNGTVFETVISCQHDNFDYSNIAVGQKINVSFN